MANSAQRRGRPVRMSSPLFFSLFLPLCLLSLPLFLTTPASGRTMSFLCVCIPGPYALTNKVMLLWLYVGKLNVRCDAQSLSSLGVDLTWKWTAIHQLTHRVCTCWTEDTGHTASVMGLRHVALSHTWTCVVSASHNVAASPFFCRTRTGNRL